MEQEKNLSTDISQKNPDIISFFNKNEDFVFLYKKTEKLVAAIYLVTNLFDSNEPIKWTLRKKSQELLDFILQYEKSLIQAKVLELVSLLQVSSQAGLISGMNLSILKQEFTWLLSHISDSGETSTQTFDKDFFAVKRENTKSAPQNVIFEKNPSREIKDNHILKDNGFRKSDRQNIIIELLRKKNDLTIKDMSRVIKNCSEKTIQRELSYFIQKGIVRRAGERRWSRYSLNG